MNSQVDKHVKALVNSLLHATDNAARRVTIDVQNNGELPYRVEVPGEILPLVGCASVEPLPEDTSGSSSSEAGSPEKETTHG